MHPLAEKVWNYIKNKDKRHFLACQLAKPLGLSSHQIGYGFRELHKMGLVEKRAYRPSGGIVWRKKQKK